jgi:hypothetical protein
MLSLDYGREGQGIADSVQTVKSRAWSYTNGVPFRLANPPN